jgi:hypothetical protein
MGKPKARGNKFLKWQRGLLPRTSYAYRIVTDVCPKCGRQITYAKKGRGKLFKLYCAYCKVAMEHLFVERHRVVKH